jgi:hypothetical protein
VDDQNLLVETTLDKKAKQRLYTHKYMMKNLSDPKKAEEFRRRKAQSTKKSKDRKKERLLASRNAILEQERQQKDETIHYNDMKARLAHAGIDHSKLIPTNIFENRSSPAQWNRRQRSHIQMMERLCEKVREPHRLESFSFNEN